MNIQKLKLIAVVILSLQLIATLERVIFDFLGYMWTSILFNIVNILLIVVALFGVTQDRRKLLTAYLIWCIVWIGCNIFVICYYLEAGVLNNDGTGLNMGLGGLSWWMSHGAGCVVVNATSAKLIVTGCALDYTYIETIHAAIQIFFAVLGICVSSVILAQDIKVDETQAVVDALEFVRMRQASAETLTSTSQTRLTNGSFHGAAQPRSSAVASLPGRIKSGKDHRPQRRYSMNDRMGNGYVGEGQEVLYSNLDAFRAPLAQDEAVVPEPEPERNHFALRPPSGRSQRSGRTSQQQEHRSNASQAFSQPNGRHRSSARSRASRASRESRISSQSSSEVDFPAHHVAQAAAAGIRQSDYRLPDYPADRQLDRQPITQPVQPIQRFGSVSPSTSSTTAKVFSQESSFSGPEYRLRKSSFDRQPPDQPVSSPQRFSVVDYTIPNVSNNSNNVAAVAGRSTSVPMVVISQSVNSTRSTTSPSRPSAHDITIPTYSDQLLKDFRDSAPRRLSPLPSSINNSAQNERSDFMQPQSSAINDTQQAIGLRNSPVKQSSAYEPKIGLRYDRISPPRNSSYNAALGVTDPKQAASNSPSRTNNIESYNNNISRPMFSQSSYNYGPPQIFGHVNNRYNEESVTDHSSSTVSPVNPPILSDKSNKPVQPQYIVSQPKASYQSKIKSNPAPPQQASSYQVISNPSFVPHINPEPQSVTNRGSFNERRSSPLSRFTSSEQNQSNRMLPQLPMSQISMSQIPMSQLPMSQLPTSQLSMSQIPMSQPPVSRDKVSDQQNFSRNQSPLRQSGRNISPNERPAQKQLNVLDLVRHSAMRASQTSLASRNNRNSNSHLDNAGRSSKRNSSYNAENPARQSALYTVDNPNAIPRLLSSEAPPAYNKYDINAEHLNSATFI